MNYLNTGITRFVAGLLVSLALTQSAARGAASS
jgi:hypothetical protein